MQDSGKDLGYIAGKVENLEKKVDKQDGHLDEISTKLDSVTEQLTYYRHIIVFIRSIFWIGAAIVTLKFGDIKDIWGGK